MPMMRQRNTGRARGEVKCGKIKKWLVTNISYAHADQSVALACVNHFAVMKGGDPFHSAATNRKVWLAGLNEGTWFKTLWTVTATYAMLHAQLSLNLHDQSNPSLLLLHRQHSTSQWPLIITMYSSQTDIMRDVSNPKQYNFNEVCLNF